MEIQVLNGLSRITPGGNPHFNGLSRMNYQLDGYSLNNYSLNGFTLNGATIDDIEEYCQMCPMNGHEPSYEGYLNGKAERQARRARRKAKRAARKAHKSRRREAKTLRKETRSERKEARKERRSEMAASLLGKAKEIGQAVLSRGGELLPETEEFLNEFEDVQDFAEEKGLFGPPSLFKKPGKWFASNKVPVWQKAGVVVGGLVVLDLAVNKGKVLKKLTGKKK